MPPPPAAAQAPVDVPAPAGTRCAPSWAGRAGVDSGVKRRRAADPRRCAVGSGANRDGRGGGGGGAEEDGRPSRERRSRPRSVLRARYG